MDPSKYIDKMEETYERLFGEPPTDKVLSPLTKGDHPELDTSIFLEENDIEIYQSLIGSMQWAVSIRRWDIQTAVMTLSSLVYCYLKNMKHFKVRFRTGEPDYSDLPDILDYDDWRDTAYSHHSEEIPTNAPVPLGKRVVLTHYYDASLMHDVLSGKAVTGVLHLYNKTPIDSYSKKQTTTETATYGSEFVACRTCIEHTIDHRNYLRYLGVPVAEKDIMWGDNKSQIHSAARPHAKLHKRHNILSFHFVRSILSQQYINLMHIKSEYNCSDLLTKHWGYNVVWKHILQPLFHFAGNTANLMYDDTLLVDISIDESKPSSIFDEHGEYEILQEAMEEGLRMSG